MVTIRENVPLAPYTYFKIGGPARFFAEALSEEDIYEALAFAHKRSVPYWVLGGGSNVLIADEGLQGLMIRAMMNDISVDGEKLVCSAGVSMARAVAVSVERGLAGFEWAIGIPGTVGGSVRGNAGCFGGEMKDVIESVEVFDASRSSLRGAPSAVEGRRGNPVALTTGLLRFARNDGEFAYRESIFKHDPSLIILSATLKLKKGNLEESRKLIARYARERTEKQDIGAQCAGCMFKNVTPSHDGAVISAGWLIDTAGCKGMRVGNAMVSKKHANYFVNCGGAMASDVRALAALVKEKVNAFHSISLEEEIQCLP